MELRHLRYFVAVAEEQNVTRAAARLHLTQPALSRQVQDLEAELGVNLFRRSGKSVRLTEAGRKFLDESRSVLARVDEAIQAVRVVAGGGQGELQVGYAPSLTVELLPAALRECKRLSPGIRVGLHDLSTEEMLAGLAEGRLHVALMIRPHARSLTHLAYEELRRYAVHVAVPGNHPLARVRRPGLDRVFREPLVAYTRKDYPEYHEWLESLEGWKPMIVEEHDSSTSLLAAVEAGRGIALVPESFSCFAGPRLKVRPLPEGLEPFSVGAVHPKAEVIPAVVDFIRAARLTPPKSGPTTVVGKAPGKVQGGAKRRRV